MQDPGQETSPGANPAFPGPERYQEDCLIPTPPSTPPNPQTASTQPNRENPQHGEESTLGHDCSEPRSPLPSRGDDNIFFAIKIPLKLRPRKMQRRKPFKLGEILFLAITMCAFQQKLFLLPPPAGCRELTLLRLGFHIQKPEVSLGLRNFSPTGPCFSAHCPLLAPGSLIPSRLHSRLLKMSLPVSPPFPVQCLTC